MATRRRLVRALDASGVLEAVLRVRARAPSPWLTVLTYHRIGRLRAHEFDDGVVDASPEDFDRQMAAIARYGRPLSLDELLAWTDGAALPRGAVAVTFDDGYLDNYELALPILQRHGVRATFFVATTFVDERRLFWWDRAAWLLKRSPRDFVELRYPALLHVQLEPPRRSAAIKAVLRLVKDHFHVDVERFLDELAVACGVELDRALERSLADSLLMNWEHVRKLRAAGMDIGSHTRRHHVLHQLPETMLDQELHGARADLEKQLRAEVRAIAYPVGHGVAAHPRVRAAVARAGYRIGFSNCSGANPLWRPRDRFDVKRMAVDYGLPDHVFRGMLAVPFLAP